MNTGSTLYTSTDTYCASTQPYYCQYKYTGSMHLVSGYTAPVPSLAVYTYPVLAENTASTQPK